MAKQATSPITSEELVLYVVAQWDTPFLNRDHSQVVRLLDQELGLRRDSYDRRRLLADTAKSVKKFHDAGAHEAPFAIQPELREQRERLVQVATDALYAPVRPDASTSFSVLLASAMIMATICASPYALALHVLLDFACLLRSVSQWCSDWDALYRAMNPPEYLHTKFHHNEDNARRLDNLVTYIRTYKRVMSPQPTWRSWFGCLYLKTLGRTISFSADLQVSISVSKSLVEPLQKQDDIEAGVIIDIGGGGMTTGSPWDPAWKARAIIQFVETQPIVYISFDRRRLPESDGKAILEDTRDAMAFLFENKGIETLVAAHFPGLKWNRRKVVLTGESAGGFLTLYGYLGWGKHICGVYLRYPLLGDYRRDPGPYMGRDVSVNDAAHSFLRICSLLEKLPDIPPAIGRFPSEGMWVAYVSSSLKTWGRLWNAPYAIDLLRQAKECPNPATKFLVVHGSEDIQVPITSSKEFVSIMQERGIQVDLHEVSSAAHGFDYDIPLSDATMAPFRHQMKDLGMTV